MSDSVGSVSVDVVPDARGWSEKLRAQIRDTTATVNVDADTGEAEAKLDETARTRTAKIKADTSQLSKGASSLDSFIGKLGLLPALAIAGGAALVPLAGVLGGIVAALAAPLVIGGGGATLFALLGGLAVKQTQAQLKSISDLETKLSGLTKGTQEYADAQKELRAQQAALSPAQERFAASLDGLKSAFAAFLGGKTGQALLGPFTQGMDLLTKLLPIAAPLLKSVSGAFSDLLGDLDNAAGSDGFRHFVDQVARLAGRDIRIGGHILGDLASGVGGLLTATDKGFSGGFLHGVERLTSSFADWANSREARHDIRELFDYVHRVGPQVGDTLGAIAHAAGRFVQALAPLGPPVLRVIEGIADALSSIPVPVLTALAGSAAGLIAFQKLGGFKAASLLGKGGPGGLVGGLAGKAGIVPVFVTNEGFGVPGTGVPGTGVPGAKTGPLGTGLKILAPLAALSAVDIGSQAAFNKLYGKKLGEFVGNIFRSVPSPVAGLPNPKMFGLLPQLPGHVKNDIVNPVSHFLGRVGGGPVVDAPDPVHLKSTTNAFDALKAHAQSASRTIDQFGPHADATFAHARADVAAFQSKLDSIHDKKFAIIAQTQQAVSALERIQAARIADKNFNIYAHYNQIERTVAPGGGQGQNPHGSAPPPTPKSGSGRGGMDRTPVHLHLDDKGSRNITGWLEDGADRVYRANRSYEDTAAGQ